MSCTHVKIRRFTPYLSTATLAGWTQTLETHYQGCIIIDHICKSWGYCSRGLTRRPEVRCIRHMLQDSNEQWPTTQKKEESYVDFTTSFWQFSMKCEQGQSAKIWRYTVCSNHMDWLNCCIIPNRERGATNVLRRRQLTNDIQPSIPVLRTCFTAAE